MVVVLFMKLCTLGFKLTLSHPQNFQPLEPKMYPNSVPLGSWASNFSQS